MGLYSCMLLATGVVLEEGFFFVLLFLSLDLRHFLVLNFLCGCIVHISLDYIVHSNENSAVLMHSWKHSNARNALVAK